MNFLSLVTFFVMEFLSCNFTGIVLCAEAATMNLNENADFFPTINKNLTKVTWAHAVNSKALLDKALEGPVMMLEADIIMGSYKDQPSNGKLFPVMGHPPDNTSDISFETFLLRVLEFNKNTINGEKKGIKLDFKSIEVFEKSVPILESVYKKMSFPVWINADILSGPINSTAVPVNSHRFLKASQQFESSILSIGWTTRCPENTTYGAYTMDQINDMIAVISENNITQNITFPVRACFAANSLDQLKLLLDSVPNSTLTIWSHPEYVDVPLLRQLIFEIGLERIYIDVPEDLKNKLNLHVPFSDEEIEKVRNCNIC